MPIPAGFTTSELPLGLGAVLVPVYGSDSMRRKRKTVNPIVIFFINIMA